MCNLRLDSIGVPVGAPVPPARLTEEGGAEISLQSLTTGDRPALLLFVDPNCPACQILLPEAARWADEGRLAVIAISPVASDPFALEAMPTLQDTGDVAARFGVRGTPSGVLVTALGTVGSPVAQGSDAIRSLVSHGLGTGPKNGKNGKNGPDYKALRIWKEGSDVL